MAQTYSFYGKDYLVDDLEKAYLSGIEDKLSEWKRGMKDQGQYIKAGTDLISGLRSGRVTFKDGRFYDSQGEYTNSKNKNKDYYGHNAHYIYSLMSNAKEYVPEKPKSDLPDWDNGKALQKYLSDQLYTGDVNNFIEMDSEVNGERKSTNRLKYLTDLFTNTKNNLSSLFGNISDRDLAEYNNLFNKAITATTDGTVDAGDYFYLGRLLPLEWRKLLGNTVIQSNKETPTTEKTEEQIIQETRQDLENQILANHGFKGNRLGKLAGIGSAQHTFDGNFATWTNNRYIDYINKIPTETLQKQLWAMIAKGLEGYNPSQDENLQTYIKGPYKLNPNYYIYLALNSLKDRGALKTTSDNKYYLPIGAKARNTHLVWDGGSNLNEISDLDISEVLDEIVAKYRKTDDSRFDKYFVQHAKNGAVLKFNLGGKNIIQTTLDNYNALGNILQNDQIFKAYDDMWGGDLSAAEKAIKGNVDLRMLHGINNFDNGNIKVKNEGIRMFNTGYQNNGKSLNDILFGTTMNSGLVQSLQGPNKPLGTGDSYNKDKSKAWIDDVLGAQTYHRVLSLTDPNTKDFGKWGDYWKGKGATGAYYYTDISGKGQWIATKDTNQDGYVAFDNVQETPKDIPIKENVSIETPESVKSETQQRVAEKPKEKKSFDWSKLYGLGRLAMSLGYNKKIEDALKINLDTPLLQTYERYSPVTGAFSEMQFRNRQAADVRRQASRPFTSDASLTLAGQLDANRQATDLEYQGFLADDKEIKRTKAEALARVEDNMARRTDVVNKNRAALVDTKNRLAERNAEIKASRLGKDWASLDSFVGGLEKEAKDKYELNKQFLAQNRAYNEQYNYEKQLAALNAEYNNLSDSEKLTNAEYINKLRELRHKHDLKLQQIKYAKLGAVLKQLRK